MSPDGDCRRLRPLQALRSKFVSADSLSKTGVFADEAGDFRWILAKVADFRRLETGQNSLKIPINAGFVALLWTLSLVERVVGWGGRDRTSEWRNQNPLPYRLATPQQACSGSRGTIA